MLLSSGCVAVSSALALKSINIDQVKQEGSQGICAIQMSLSIPTTVNILELTTVIREVPLCDVGRGEVYACPRCLTCLGCELCEVHGCRWHLITVAAYRCAQRSFINVLSAWLCLAWLMS